jgi:hypothetical protein
MFVVWAITVPLIASSYLSAYLKHRRTGVSEGDWTFLRNRWALSIGGVVAVLLTIPNIHSFAGLAFAVPAAMLLGGLVAMALNRYGPLAHRSSRED